MIETFDLGDIVQMKKQHPCGSKEFEVIRLGADIKIKCVGCGRIVMIPRSKFQKDAKWDGLKGYITNAKLDKEEILANYARFTCSNRGRIASKKIAHSDMRNFFR